MSDGVMILDSEDKIETLNKTLEDISGIRYNNTIGKTPIETFRNIEWQNLLGRFKETKIPVSQEIVLVPLKRPSSVLLRHRRNKF